MKIHLIFHSNSSQFFPNSEIDFDDWIVNFQSVVAMVLKLKWKKILSNPIVTNTSIKMNNGYQTNCSLYSIMQLLETVFESVKFHCIQPNKSEISGKLNLKIIISGDHMTYHESIWFGFLWYQKFLPVAILCDNSWFRDSAPSNLCKGERK